MARKPADQASSPRDLIWAAIRARQSSPFTVADLTDSTSAHPKTIRDYCKGLVAAGYLQAQPALAGQLASWILIKDSGVETPRIRPDGSAVTQGVVNEQLWRGMVIMAEFSYLDLIQTATVPIPVETAKGYCKMLLATGYLRVLVKAEPSVGRIARYRLVRNKGPKPPQIQRVKRVFDPNSREVFMPEERL